MSRESRGRERARVNRTLTMTRHLKTVSRSIKTVSKGVDAVGKRSRH